MIRCDAVSKRYGDFYALNRASFELERGEFCAIQGSSGSGKSTLMNILGLLDKPSAGALIIDGVNMSALSRAALARARNQIFGFVFQNFQLLPRLMAWENVALPLIYRGIGKAERRVRALEALSLVGLSDRTHHRPSELSGGQCQRVAIARALIGSPKAVLADEPTGSLDSVTAEAIMDLLKSVNANLGVTVLIVTHDHAIAQSCQRRILMRDGNVV